MFDPKMNAKKFTTRDQGCPVHSASATSKAPRHPWSRTAIGLVEADVGRGVNGLAHREGRARPVAVRKLGALKRLRI